MFEIDQGIKAIGNAFVSLFSGAAVSGAIGSVIYYLRFSGEKKDVFKFLISAMSGSASAYYLTPLVVHYMSIMDDVNNGVAFLIGLFGMSLASSIISIIKTHGAEFLMRWIK